MTAVYWLLFRLVDKASWILIAQCAVCWNSWWATLLHCDEVHTIDLSGRSRSVWACKIYPKNLHPTVCHIITPYVSGSHRFSSSSPDFKKYGFQSHSHTWEGIKKLSDHSIWSRFFQDTDLYSSLPKAKRIRRCRFTDTLACSKFGPWVHHASCSYLLIECQCSEALI